jgi:hypothetical protein
VERNEGEDFLGALLTQTDTSTLSRNQHLELLCCQ